MTDKKMNHCEPCANTAILSAGVIKNDETGERKIIVRPCKRHFDKELLEKNLTAISTVGLPIEIRE